MSADVPAPTVLWDLAHQVLDSALRAGLTPQPARTYVHMGSVAWDCGEQLVVSVQGIVPDQLAGGARQAAKQACAVVPKLTFNVEVLRCVATLGPKGEFPKSEVLDGEGKQLAEDLWRLWYTLANDWSHGDLFDNLSCDLVSFGTTVALGPQGGLAGWRIPLVVTSPS